MGARGDRGGERPVRWRPLAELELLISGAVVFALFGLPGRLQTAFLHVEAKVGDDLFLFPFMLFYLCYLLALALIIAFSTHFLLRSCWVAIAGLNQVFPDGIDWKRLDMSPIGKRIARDAFPSTAELEIRLDRAASTVFSVLFYLTVQLFCLFVVVGLLLAFLVPLKRWLAPSMGQERFMLAVFTLLFAPVLTSSLVDRWFKTSPERMERWPRLAAGLEKILRAYHRVFLSGLYLPIPLTFASHTSSRATAVASSGAIVVIVGLFIASFLVGTGFVGFDSFAFFPEGVSEFEIDPRHYENLGRGDAHTPTLDRDVVDGPYLRLFLPFDPRREGRRMGETCPGLEPLREEGLYLRRREARREIEPGYQARLLSCLSSLYRLELNGQEVRPEVGFYRHPETGVRGLRAYLPTAGLPEGRNLLTIRRAPSRRELDEAQDVAERRWLERRGTSHLPFWK